MTQNHLKDDIRRLLIQKNAVLLAHNYQRDEIQEIADHTGDSLGLAQIAAGSAADVIVFAGVHFMAESASILAPGKTVILPRREAGCPMADMITPEGGGEAQGTLSGRHSCRLCQHFGGSKSGERHMLYFRQRRQCGEISFA
jgi:quinolinate synthase